MCVCIFSMRREEEQEVGRPTAADVTHSTSRFPQLKSTKGHPRPPPPLPTFPSHLINLLKWSPKLPACLPACPRSPKVVAKVDFQRTSTSQGTLTLSSLLLSFFWVLTPWHRKVMHHLEYTNQNFISMSFKYRSLKWLKPLLSFLFVTKLAILGK
jgi:hypothetical protein